MVHHGPWPAVDVYATAGDVAALVRWLLDEASSRASAAGDVPDPTRFGLGVLPLELGGRATWGHEGEDAGASTFFAADVVTGRGVVVLSNGDAFTGGDPARARALAELGAAELFEA